MSSFSVVIDGLDEASARAFGFLTTCDSDEFAARLQQRWRDYAEDLALDVIPHISDKPVLILQWIFVAEELRGRGHGTALLAKVNALADTHGASILLEADLTETHSHGFNLLAFYLQHGFSVAAYDVRCPILLRRPPA